MESVLEKDIIMKKEGKSDFSFENNEGLGLRRLKLSNFLKKKLFFNRDASRREIIDTALMKSMDKVVSIP